MTNGKKATNGKSRHRVPKSVSVGPCPSDTIRTAIHPAGPSAQIWKSVPIGTWSGVIVSTNPGSPEQSTPRASVLADAAPRMVRATKSERIEQTSCCEDELKKTESLGRVGQPCQVRTGENHGSRSTPGARTAPAGKSCRE